jgi:hypothetical protein
VITEVHAADTVTVGLVERRRGRPRRVPMPIEALQRPKGRPLSPRDLADLTGFSVAKIRNLCKWGKLKAIKVDSNSAGTRFQWVIPYGDAQRLLKKLRILE